MTPVTFMCEQGPQNPIYGLNQENIVPCLTCRNWKTKALWRSNADGNARVYIFIEQGVKDVSGRGDTDPSMRSTPEGGVMLGPSGTWRRVYCVSVYGDGTNKLPAKYCPTFARLQQALDFANGEGNSPFSSASEQADINLLPASSGKMIITPLRKRRRP